MMKDIIVAEVVQEKQTYDIAILNSTVDIVSKVDEIAANVEKRIAELKLDKIEATEENKKKITALRTSLNKELLQYNEDLKTINKIINAPLDLLKSQVKSKIEVLYKEKVNLLKDKLEAITKLQLVENEEYSKTYHASKLKSANIRIGVDYKDVPWEFSFGSSKASIRKTVDDHFQKIQDALVVIDGHEYKEQLEQLWIKNKYDLGQALLELQTQINLANQILKQKEANLKAEQERLDKLAEQERLDKLAEQERLSRSASVEPSKIVVSEVPIAEVITEYNLRVELTDTQLKDLVSFLMDAEIDFSLVE